MCYLDVVIGAQGSGESQQERITNLLKKLQLMERCLHDTEQKSEEVYTDYDVVSGVY